jgi:hypothetical protein
MLKNLLVGRGLQAVVCLLPLLVGRCICFRASPMRVNVVGRHGSPRLSMSYLDNLSPPPDPDEKKDKSSEEKKSSGPKWAAVTGGIPTGRGPEASYLQAMNDGSSANNNDSEDDDSEEEEVPPPVVERPASWSSEYLTDFLTKDDSRTDVRNLLTQRSIQSFMYLLETCRDPHSAKWIQEDFLQTGNLLDFHGTGAAFIERFGGTWDAALLEMIQKPKDRIIISAKRRGRGHGGWSKNNPYLKERWMEMPIDIYPSR